MLIPRENKYLQTSDLKNVAFTAGSLRKINANYPIKELFSKEYFSTLEGRDNRGSLWVLARSRHDVVVFQDQAGFPRKIDVLIGP